MPDVGERLALFLGADAIRHFEENDGEPILPNGLAHPVIPTIQPSELTGKALGFAGIDNLGELVDPYVLNSRGGR